MDVKERVVAVANFMEFTVAKLSCRFRMTADNGDELCVWHESSVGQCKIWLCPLVEKFGITADGVSGGCCREELCPLKREGK